MEDLFSTFEREARQKGLKLEKLTGAGIVSLYDDDLTGDACYVDDTLRKYLYVNMPDNIACMLDNKNNIQIVNYSHECQVSTLPILIETFESYIKARECAVSVRAEMKKMIKSANNDINRVRTVMPGYELEEYAWSKCKELTHIAKSLYDIFTNAESGS